MRKAFNIKLAAVLFAFGCSNRMNAQSVNSSSIVTTAVPFLRISPDARAGGMGELGIATSPDANSSFYNLAKTPFSAKANGIGFTYTPWLTSLGLNDVYLLSAAGYHKLDDNQAISGSLRYFSLGNIQFTDFNGNQLGQGSPRELGADLGYSRKLSGKLSIALAFRYIYSNLASGFASGGTAYKPGKAAAADVSLFYNGRNQDGQGWNFGAALSNLGSKIGYTNNATDKEFIPATLGVGATYTKVFDEQNKISFGLDVNKLLVPTAPLPTNPTNATQDSINLANYQSESVTSSWFKSFGNSAYTGSLGAEYAYDSQFFLRAGYFYEGKNQGDRQYFTLGAGLKYSVATLNFSYIVPSGSGTTRNPLSNTVRFGLIFDID